MYKNASERLIAKSDAIMKRWEERAVDEVLAALKLESLALRNSLPELLAVIAHVLSTTTSRTEARKKYERDESLRVGKKHGQERASSQQYSIG